MPAFNFLRILRVFSLPVAMRTHQRQLARLFAARIRASTSSREELGIHGQGITDFFTQLNLADDAGDAPRGKRETSPARLACPGP